ncbi:hypothetical protein GCM10017044_15390 [Kordiimonas sediminis]|uniref:Uncharacterized protein n=1 Tax=Kordiimonas sediminis TaxID=1735581 RepID=A0A919E7I2_9PROT|nr:hypothetical protein GCM10017044_15390 [Kordiimonas sediminis]
MRVNTLHARDHFSRTLSKKLTGVDGVFNPWGCHRFAGETLGLFTEPWHEFDEITGSEAVVELILQDVVPGILAGTS